MVKRGDIVVLKFGSSTFVSPAAHAVNHDSFTEIAASIACLHKAGMRVVIVSSGAVALGRRQLTSFSNRVDLTSKQVLATIGQHHLMALWAEALSKQNMLCGQVLVTKAELSSRTANLNVRDTLKAMLQAGVVPIVNENDSVAVDEIRYGDNDSLASQVALVVGATGVLLWTDVQGLFTANPRRDPDATLIAELAVADIDALRPCVSGAGTSVGTGGMQTKLEAALLASTGGIWTRIAGCSSLARIDAVLSGAMPSTIVVPSVGLQDGRTRWIVANAGDGRVVCNAGAADRIVTSGASLLAVGVEGVSGAFVRGDIIKIFHGDSHIATGIARYDAEDIQKIAGCREAAIEQIIGYTNGAVVVHRDDMAIV